MPRMVSGASIMRPRMASSASLSGAREELEDHLGERLGLLEMGMVARAGDRHAARAQDGEPLVTIGPIEPERALTALEIEHGSSHAAPEARRARPRERHRRGGLVQRIELPLAPA